MITLQLYTKPTSNYPAGLPLQNFQRLSPEWSGEGVLIPFGPDQLPLETVELRGMSVARHVPVARVGSLAVNVAKQAGTAVGLVCWQ